MNGKTTMNMTDTNQQAVDQEALCGFLRWLFEYAEFDGGVISLLGIGEKGTHQEGQFRERVFIEPGDYQSAIHHATRWGQHSIGTFIVPAVLSRAAQVAGDATADKVAAFTSLVVDIDSGDTGAKLEWASRHIGRPSLVIESGGVTQEGHPKLHAWWRLSEQTEDVEQVGMLRKAIAARVGGDQSFGRITQIIRMPGTIHGKNGKSRLVRVRSVDRVEYDLMDLSEAIIDMPRMPGLPAQESNVVQLMLPDGTMDFSLGAGRDQNRTTTALTQPVHEGGEDRTRWGEFSKVAGHHIHCARRGDYSVEEAFRMTQGWVLANMVPPWPESRVRQEWIGLLNKDVMAHGAFPAAGFDAPAIQQQGRVLINSADDLLSWATHRRTTFNPPARKVLVDGLVMSGKRHLFAAEGGAGKTFLLMDLAIKLALAGPVNDMFWMGQKVLPDAHDGHVVLITGEDDMEELDHRWHAIDPTGDLRRQAGDRLITLPMEDMGGTFPFAEVDHTSQREKPSREWMAICGALRALQADGKRVSAVIVDTLNTSLHGDENKAEVIAQYFRIVSPITSELKAALVVSHHIKKGKEDRPIKTLDDMKLAVRGSSALINGVRVALGFWHANDYKDKMTSMGLRPKRNTLYCAGVLKSNAVAFEGFKYLLRGDTGLLHDVTGRLSAIERSNTTIQGAWLAFCINHYAEQGFYLSVTGRDNGVHNQIDKLHPCLRQLAKHDLEKLARDMVASGALIKRSIHGMGTSAHWLDLKENQKKRRVKGQADRAAFEPDWSDYQFDNATGKVLPLEGQK